MAPSGNHATPVAGEGPERRAVAGNGLAVSQVGTTGPAVVNSGTIHVDDTMCTKLRFLFTVSDDEKHLKFL